MLRFFFRECIRERDESHDFFNFSSKILTFLRSNISLFSVLKENSLLAMYLTKFLSLPDEQHCAMHDNLMSLYSSLYSIVESDFSDKERLKNFLQYIDQLDFLLLSTINSEEDYSFENFDNSQVYPLRASSTLRRLSTTHRTQTNILKMLLLEFESSFLLRRTALLSRTSSRRNLEVIFEKEGMPLRYLGIYSITRHFFLQYMEMQDNINSILSRVRKMDIGAFILYVNKVSLQLQQTQDEVSQVQLSYIQLREKENSDPIGREIKYSMHRPELVRGEMEASLNNTPCSFSEGYGRSHSNTPLPIIPSNYSPSNSSLNFLLEERIICFSRLSDNSRYREEPLSARSFPRTSSVFGDEYPIRRDKTSHSLQVQHADYALKERIEK